MNNENNENNLNNENILNNYNLSIIISLNHHILIKSIILI